MTNLRATALLLLGALAVGPAESLRPDPHREARRVVLPTGQIASVIEGEHEPRSTGSYAVRIYAPSEIERSMDRFVAGLVRTRDGTLEDVRVDDIDRDGRPELLVLVRNAGSGSFLQIDAFTIVGDGPKFVLSLDGLPHDAVPEVEVEKAWSKAARLASPSR